MSSPTFPFDDRFEFLEEELKNIDAANEDWSAVEEMIFAARNYVVPGDQLRPRSIEAAREVYDEKRRVWRFTKLAAAMFLMFALLIPTLKGFSFWRDNRLVTDSSEIEQRAQEMTRTANTGPHWGLYEAFSELRTQQAARLGRVIP